jgi:CHAD domain-containing protein
MAFRLKRRGGMPKQLRRIVRAELRTALEALDGATLDDEGIYEARKSVKKIRAILRLLRRPLASDYWDENARLRTVARGLSSLRDADATLDTLHELHGRYPTAVSAHVVRAVSRGLSSRKRHVEADMEPIVRHAKATLVASCRDVPAEIERVGDFSAARGGAVTSYRRARKACQGLAVDAEASAFHEWRKRTKDHWYHVRLFGRLPHGPRSRMETLRRLEQCLGKDHDLATLCSIVLDGDDRYGDARTRTLLLGSIMRCQASLRRQALALGTRLFGPSAKDFETSVTDWWRRR